MANGLDPNGGRRRPTGPSIGRKSQQMKLVHWAKRIGLAAGGALAVIIAAGIIGGLMRGLGFWGVMFTALALIAVVGPALFYPRMKAPSTDELRRADLPSLAGKTEIWLEAQRPALPPPAVPLIDNIGYQLDQLAPQLQKLDEGSQPAYEIRRLVGEHLPGMIESYRAIPTDLQRQQGSGRSPEQELVNGLGLIEQEIASVTQQIAQGEIDKLSTTGRFLEIKYRSNDED